MRRSPHYEPIAKAQPKPGSVNELHDVDVTAISIVDKGANRKRFFLRKRSELAADPFELPGHRDVIAKADWSAVYCVVAEPGSLEDPGMHGDQSIPDRWASADEIRKACHRFSKNGGLINKMHESLAPFGQLVENAIAPIDFSVTDPYGTEQVIKGGSWYVAIEPNADGRAAIEDGTFTGISIEGGGVRKLVEKALKPGERAKAGGPLRHLIAYYLKKPHPFTACVRDNRKRFGKRAEAICAKLKDIGLGTTKWRNQKGIAKAGKRETAAEITARLADEWYDDGLTDADAKLALAAVQSANSDTVGGGVKKLLAKLGVNAGLDPAEVDELLAEDDPLAKARPTFAERMARRDFEDELPGAFDELRSAVYSAFWPMPDGDDDTDPRTLIGESLDEFKAWALDLLDASKIEKVAEQLEDVETAAPASALPEPIGKAERKFSAGTRRKLAGKGHAMPDGSFPIPDKGALKRAIRAIGRAPAGKRSAVIAHIKRRAKALKATDLLPESFAKTIGQTPLSDTVEDVLTEEQIEQLGKVSELADKIDGLPAAIAKAIKDGDAGEGEGDEGKGAEGDDKPPTLADVAKSLKDLSDKVDATEQKVTALGSGQSSGDGNGSGDPATVAKGSAGKPYEGIL